MLNRRTHLRLRQLGLIVITWLFIGFLIAVYDHLVLHTANSAGPSADYSFQRSLFVNMLAGFIGALLVGLYALLFVLLNLEAWSLLIGSVLLLMRNRWAIPVLGLSLLGAILGLGYQILLAPPPPPPPSLSPPPKPTAA